jgi:hypothetical protein
MKTLPKELRTCRNAQSTQRNTLHNMVSLDFTGFGIRHKGWKWGALQETGAHTERKGKEREREGISPEGEEMSAGARTPEDHRRGGEIAGVDGDRLNPRAEAEKQRIEVPCLGREGERIF